MNNEKHSHQGCSWSNSEINFFKGDNLWLAEHIAVSNPFIFNVVEYTLLLVHFLYFAFLFHETNYEDLKFYPEINYKLYIYIYIYIQIVWVMAILVVYKDRRCCLYLSLFGLGLH